MPVNGLLLTLGEDEDLVNDTLSFIVARDDIELGDRTGRWQPVVVEAGCTGESHDVHEWLEALPGVVMVDVVFTSVGDSNEGDDDFELDQAKQSHLQEQVEEAKIH